MKIITCCKDCKERHVGCHAECEKYSSQKNAIQKVKDDRARLQETEYTIDRVRGRAGC